MFRVAGHVLRAARAASSPRTRSSSSFTGHPTASSGRLPSQPWTACRSTSHRACSQFPAPAATCRDRSWCVAGRGAWQCGAYPRPVDRDTPMTFPCPDASSQRPPGVCSVGRRADRVGRCPGRRRRGEEDVSHSALLAERVCRQAGPHSYLVPNQWRWSPLGEWTTSVGNHSERTPPDAQDPGEPAGAQAECLSDGCRRESARKPPLAAWAGPNPCRMPVNGATARHSQPGQEIGNDHAQ